MKYALLNPRWEFAGSSYFGCQEHHFPFELLFARAELERAGHDILLIDAQLEDLPLQAVRQRLRAFAPDFLVLTTAPSYLFWRCPQPELRLPGEWLRSLRDCARVQVAIGPHGSATPATAGRKLGADVVMRGEPEQALAQLAQTDWASIPGCCFRRESGEWHCDARLAAADLAALAPLDFSGYPLELRQHRHHVFSGQGRGAELEFTRGCPWGCDFCNKTLFRDRFRMRPQAAVLAEIETLLRAGFDYFYFIDEIFGCGRPAQALLGEMESLPLTFGMQTRMDLWNEEGLNRLGRAHCVSLECGIEEISESGRAALNKGCRLSTERLSELLRAARRHIAWVQANLIAPDQADAAHLAEMEAWRQQMMEAGVWVSQPVPLFPYPGTARYTQQFGPPDDAAWERAHAHYLHINRARRYFSDQQSASPAPLAELEAGLSAAVNAS